MYVNELSARMILRESLRLLRQRTWLYLEEPYYSGEQERKHELHCSYVFTDGYKTLNEFSLGYLVPMMCTMGDLCCQDYPDGVSFHLIDEPPIGRIFEQHDGVSLFLYHRANVMTSMMDMTFTAYTGPGSWLM